MKFYLYIFLVTILFIGYIECQVGNILFRTNSFGTISLNIPSLFNYLIHPLYNTFLWSFQTLDINYIFILGISILIYKFIYIK